MTSFQIGDEVLVLGKVKAIVEHIYTDEGGGGVKVTVLSETSDKKWWTVLPAHWLEFYHE